MAGATCFAPYIKVRGEFVKIYLNKKDAKVEGIFYGFFVNYWRKVGAMAVVGIFQLALFAVLPFVTETTRNWILLLLIPIIIWWLVFFMTAFILEQYPKVTAINALKLSARMTKGYNGKLFGMIMGFVGWWVLIFFGFLLVAFPVSLFLSLDGITTLFTLLIGVTWITFLGPYMYATFAGYYTVLLNQALASGIVTRYELEGYPEKQNGNSPSVHLFPLKFFETKSRILS